MARRRFADRTAAGYSVRAAGSATGAVAQRIQAVLKRATHDAHEAVAAGTA